jgi:RNA polymerase sigma factor (TIGR02999 family)
MATDVTQLLHAHGAGVPDALDRLLPIVYDDLRRIARGQLRRRPDHSMDTGGLVHEAYLRLVDQTRATWNDRGHFFAVSALAMRQILVDRARRRLRVKRGGDQVLVPLSAGDAAADHDAQLVLDVDLALQRLSAADPALARVVECRFFAGLTDDETASALGLPVRTAQRQWFKARAWLRAELGGAG